MNICVIVDLLTDGGFYLEENLPKYEEDVLREFEDYHIFHIFTGEEIEVKEKVKEFLKTIYYNLKFKDKHTLLQDHVFLMFADAIDEVESMKDKDYYTNGLRGYYKGSKIIIKVF